MTIDEDFEVVGALVAFDDHPATVASWSRIQSELKRLEEELEDARQYSDAEFEAMREGEEKALARMLMDLPGPEHTIAALEAELSRLREDLKASYASEAQLAQEIDQLREALDREREMRNELSKERKEHADERARLREENERLRGNLKGNPVLSTFDGIARLRKIEEAVFRWFDKKGFPIYGPYNDRDLLALFVEDLRNVLEETGDKDPGPPVHTNDVCRKCGQPRAAFKETE